MVTLEYRLHELQDAAQRRALIDDMIEHYKADSQLVAFLCAVDDALSAAEEEYSEDMQELRQQVRDLQNECADLDTTADELRVDVAYWQEQASRDSI